MLLPRSHAWTPLRKWLIVSATIVGLVVCCACIYNYERYHRGPGEEQLVPFDEDAAREAASRAAERRAAGKPVDFRDIEIAGIVSAKRATLATRNVRHFADLRIGLVDPWAKR